MKHSDQYNFRLLQSAKTAPGMHQNGSNSTGQKKIFGGRVGRHSPLPNTSQWTHTTPQRFWRLDPSACRHTLLLPARHPRSQLTGHTDRLMGCARRQACSICLRLKMLLLLKETTSDRSLKAPDYALQIQKQQRNWTVKLAMSFNL